MFYSKFSFNQCAVKEGYDVFVLELVHMSLVNVKKLVTKLKNFRLTVHNSYSKGYVFLYVYSKGLNKLNLKLFHKTNYIYITNIENTII